MAIPPYVDSNTVIKREWEVEQLRHMQNMLRIEKKQSARIDNKRPSFFNKEFRKERAKEFYQWGNCHIERSDSIRRENHKMLDRLVEISAHPRLQQTTAHTRSSHSAMSRRKQQVEVAAANAQMASRLSTTTSTFSVRRWERSFDQAQKYKKMISKPHHVPQLTPEPKTRRSKSGFPVS